jgi:hypothetical protein
MNSYINLIAFGTFGNPNGFRQTFFDFVGNKELAKNIKTFDLNTNAIKLFPNSRVYAIRKEHVAGLSSISSCLYSFAKEQNSDRSGTFIGAGILCTGKIAQEEIILSQLNEYHSSLVARNLQNDIIQVNHSDRLSILKPNDFRKIDYQLRDIENVNFLQFTGKNLVVFTPTDNVSLYKLFNKSLDLLNIYDSVYFTDNREVAEFVNQRGIFKIVQNVGGSLDFEKEIQAVLDERKRKRDQSMSEFERELQILNDDKVININDFKLQIEQAEKIHRENELRIKEAKRELEIIHQLYDEFSNKIRELSGRIKSGEKLEVVRQLYDENRNRFIDGLQALKRPIYTNKVPKFNQKSNLKARHLTPHGETKKPNVATENDLVEERRKFRLSIPKLITFILVLLLLLSVVYFIFFYNWTEDNLTVKNDIENVKNSKEAEEEIEEEASEKKVFDGLTPVPNNKLNDRDYRFVASKLAYNSKLEDVVKVIFESNPSKIKRYYSGQDVAYSKYLLDLNRDCFYEKEGVYYFSKDTIRNIPSRN